MIKLYEHPEYDLNKANWTFSKDMYQGDHATLSGGQYLWRHRLELKDNKDFNELGQARARRTRYLNFDRIVVSLIQSFFFRQAPEPDDATKKLLGQSWYDVDGNGTNFFSFSKLALANLLIYGKPIILVEAGEAPRSGAEDEKHRPRFYIINPLDNPDWIDPSELTGRFTGFQMFRREYSELAPRVSSRQEPKIIDVSDEYIKTPEGVIVARFHRAREQNQNTPTGVGEDQGTWKQVDEFLLNTSEIPVSSYSTESWLLPVSHESLRFHNLRSNYDNILYHSGYRQKFIASSGEVAELSKVISEAITPVLPEGSTLLTFEPDDASGYSEAMRNSISTIFKIGLNRLEGISEDTRAVRASDTIQAEDRNFLTFIEATIDDVEDLLNDSIRHYAAFKGIENFNGKVTLSKDITEESVETFILLWNSLKDELQNSDLLEVKKEAITKAIRAMKLENEDDLVKAVKDSTLDNPSLGRNDILGQAFRDE